VAHALGLERDGAAILDLGAESSRPGAEAVSADEEMRRLLPVLEELRPQTQVPISVDTTKAEVAAAALERGADWINDITALRADPELSRVAAEHGAPVVLMHMQGLPATMQAAPSYDDVVAEVVDSLEERLGAAVAAGIPAEHVLVDPGIGFGKRLEHNTGLLLGLARLRRLGRPVVLGVSRKSFLGELLTGDRLEPPSAERDVATVAAMAVGHAAGVCVHRVHNVRYARDALRTLTGIGRLEG
jgi:dihydropteroate synthase